MTSPMTLPILGQLRKLQFEKEDLLALWQKAAAKAALEVRTHERVEHLALGDDGLFLVQTSKDSYRALSVVLAIGRRGSPRKLGVPGEELPKVMYTLIDAEAYRGKQILVVGGGDSAVEAALGLAHQKGNKVTLSYRKDSFSRLKDRNARKIRDAMRRNQVMVRFNSQPLEIRERSVILEIPGGRVEVPNDYVWVFAGGLPPNTFLESIGVRLGMHELSEEVRQETKGVA
jgi:thioredoxin reductase